MKINDKIFIIGAGPIGLGQLQLAKASGADVIIADVIDSSLRMAKALGADEIVNIKNEDVYKRVMEFTNQRGVDISFECAGWAVNEKNFDYCCRGSKNWRTVVRVGGFDDGKTSIELEWKKYK